MCDTGRVGRAGGVLALVALIACGNGSSTSQPMEENSMEVTSTFEHEAAIPQVYTCDGDDISPPLTISSLPEETVSLALLVEDPDAPSGTFDHWVAFDIPPTENIPEAVGALGTAGVNSTGGLGYTGPCPPSGTHRYFFRVYALDTDLGLEEGLAKQALLEAIDGHVLAQGTLMGTYSR